MQNSALLCSSHFDVLDVSIALSIFCYDCSIFIPFLLVEIKPVKVLAFPSNNDHRERDPFQRRRSIKWTL